MNTPSMLALEHQQAEADELLVAGLALYLEPLPNVTPSMLARPSCRAILQTCLDRPGEVENTEVFQAALRQNAEAAGVTTEELARAVDQAVDMAATYRGRERFVRVTADNVRRRHARQTAEAAVEALHVAGADADKLAAAYARLAAVDAEADARPRTALELLDAYLEARKPLEGLDAVGLKTPDMPRLSEALCGWHGLVMLGAGPGVGKTSFTVAAGLSALEHQEDACWLFLSAEMPTMSMTARLVSTLGGLWSRHSWLQTPAYQAKDAAGIDRYRRLASRFSVIGNDVIGQLGGTVAKECMEPLRRLVEAERARMGKARCFVVLDNFQALDVVGADREPFAVDLERDRYAMTGLMELRRRLSPYDPLVVISETTKGKWGKPGQDALLGTGRLGYGADVVATMTRFRWDEPDADEPEGDERPVVKRWGVSERDREHGVPLEVNVWKARDPARTGRFRYVMDPRSLRFTEVVDE